MATAPMVNMPPAGATQYATRGIPGTTYAPSPPVAAAYTPDKTAGTPYSPDPANGPGIGLSNVKPLIQGVFPGPAAPDTSMLGQATNNAFQTGTNLGNERQDYTPSITSQQQAGALANLQQAAQGNVPSAAQLQGQQQAQQGAANQFGIAAALQGGNSAGNALRQASEGAGQLQANVANSAMINRANEMAQARGQYAGAIQNARGQDIDWQKALLGGQLQSNQTAGTAAGAQANANTNAAAATNSFNASPYGMVSNLVGKIF